MTKRKLLFRLGNLEGGGAEKVLSTILKSLDRQKFEIDVLVHRRSGVYLKQVPEDVDVYHLGKGESFLGDSWLPKPIERKIEKKKYKWLKSNDFYAYQQVLKNKKYDIEIAFLQDIIPFITSNHCSKAKMGWIHTDLSVEGYLTPKIKKKIIKNCRELDYVVCVSERAHEQYVKMGGCKRRSSVLYNPIDAEEIVQKSYAYEVERKAAVEIVAIGRLIDAKRIDRLIDCVKMLRIEGVEDFHVSVLGEGELIAELQQKIKQNQLDSYIELMGFVENPYPYIRQADIFALCSDREGYPVVIAESMILNTPIISTRVAGSVEALKDGELGLLTALDKVEFKNGLKKLILDDSLRNSFSEKLKNEELPFLKENIIPKIEELLLKVS